MWAINSRSSVSTRPNSDAPLACMGVSPAAGGCLTASWELSEPNKLVHRSLTNQACLCFFTQSSPERMRERMAVGAV